MFLTGTDIAALVDDGRLVIEPFDVAMLKPASYVLRLSSQIMRWNADAAIDLLEPDAAGLALGPTESADPIVLGPGALVLGATLERVGIPEDHVGQLTNLSHLARFGLSVTQGSSLVSPGYGREAPTALTLELHSVNPSVLNLRPGMPVCHLTVARLTGERDRMGQLAQSVYDAAPAPGRPRFWDEFRSNLRRP